MALRARAERAVAVRLVAERRRWRNDTTARAQHNDLQIAAGSEFAVQRLDLRANGVVRAPGRVRDLALRAAIQGVPKDLALGRRERCERGVDCGARLAAEPTREKRTREVVPDERNRAVEMLARRGGRARRVEFHERQRFAPYVAARAERVACC